MYCIVAIFKNESEIIKEWLEHYIREGCKKFFLIDNGSNDDYIDKIEYYRDKIDLIIDNKKHGQKELYNKYFKDKVKDYEWVLVCDLDEFVYSRKQYKTTIEYLKTVDDDVTCILIPWKIFGSNGYNTVYKKEPESVIKSFTKRCIYNKPILLPGIKYIKDKTQMGLCKSFIRTKFINYLGIHTSETKEGKIIQSNNKDVNRDNFIPISEILLEESFLHINHYAIRSLDWFKRVKMTRGSATSEYSEKKKSTVNYFLNFDKFSNERVDTELLKKL